MRHDRPGIILLALAVVLLIGFATAAEPETADFEDAFQKNVPSGWRLAEFAIDAQENYGTEVEPDVRTRFRAIVEASTDTFTHAGELEHATLLRPTISEGEQRIFYGIATSVLRLGKWEIGFDLENDPTEGTGFPIDYFSGRRIVLGSEAEKELRIQLEEEAQAATEAEVADLRREEEIRRQERAMELAEAAHDEAKAEARHAAEREAELAAVKHRAAMEAALREEAAAEWQARKEEMQELLQELPAAITSELARHLPSYWKIQAVEVTESLLDEGFEEPEFFATFKAGLELTEDTYSSGRTEDGVLLLDLSLPEGHKYDLQGTVEASWAGGIWKIMPTLENLAGISGGKSRGQFPAEALIAGTAEEEAFWNAQAEQQEESKKRELAEIERQREVEAAEHEARRSSAAEAAQLVEMERAARFAEVKELEAAMSNDEDRAAKAAAIDFILSNSNDPLFVARATAVALESGDSALIALAFRRTVADMDSLSLSGRRNGLSTLETIIFTNITVQDDRQVSLEMQGSKTLGCGVLTGRFEAARLNASDDNCAVDVWVTEDITLKASVLASNGDNYQLAAHYPGLSE